MKHELIYTWPEHKAVRDRINEIAVATDAIIDNREWDTRREEYNRLWDERHALEAKLDKMRNHTIPEDLSEELQEKLYKYLLNYE